MPGRWCHLHVLQGYQEAPALLPQVLAVAGVTDDPFWVMLFIMQEAPDPNVTRDRLLDPWIQARPTDG